MPRFAANLSFLYQEHAFLDRFEAAASDGFAAVEFLFPYAWEPQELADRLKQHGLQQALFNAPPAGLDTAAMAAAWDKGERGTACLPGREAECRAGIEKALEYAKALACSRIHVMAGCPSPDLDAPLLHRTYVANLRWAALAAAAQGCDVLIEPLNPYDMPGYYLQHQALAHAVCQEVGATNLKVQMDLYHCQRTEGNALELLRQYLPTGRVGHIQIASVPDRQEPDHGELDCGVVFSLLDALGYTGWVGCEYRPRAGGQPGGTRRGLGWRPQ
jgi:hydroxypyruvate isomerase